MNIPVLGIPHYNRPDLLLRCVQSIDYPVDKLVITQNGKDEDMPAVVKPACVRELVHIRHPNAGVAGSWNEVIMLFPAPWWMLVNNDIQFTPGDLQKLAEATWSYDGVPCLLYGNHGASWFTQTAACVYEAGLYDANLHPGYLEDCDYSYRCDLLQILRTTVAECNAIHGEQVRGAMHGSRTVNATPQLAAENSRTHGNNFRYYVKKWGGQNGHEKYTTPFNNPNLPIDYWNFDPQIRAEQQWKL